jgi:hypothetical protein
MCILRHAAQTMTAQQGFEIKMRRINNIEIECDW